MFKGAPSRRYLGHGDVDDARRVVGLEQHCQVRAVEVPKRRVYLGRAAKRATRKIIGDSECESTTLKHADAPFEKLKI